MSHPGIRQLRVFGAGAFLSVMIATCGFVAVRNHELAASQVELADRDAAAIAEGRTPVPGVHAVLVGAAESSKKHPFVSRRHVRDGHDWRPLSAAGGPDDKLFYDAAARFEHSREAACAAQLADAERTIRTLRLSELHASILRDGARARCAPRPFVEMLRDGSGRAISVRAATSGIEPRAAIAIAVTPPARPAPYPWLVMIGVLGLGLALSAAGALIAGPRSAWLGTFAGVSALAIPCALWGAPIAVTAIVIVAAGLALAQRVRVTDRFAAGLRANKTALGFLAPAALAMLVLVAAPFVIGLVLGFFDHHHGTWTFVGLDNFGEILSGGGRPLDDPLNFWFILGVTVLWTVVNVAFHVTLGVALALVLSRGWLRGRGVLRTLFILPWSIPNYITALIWRGMFEGEYGAINSILDAAGLDHVSWFSSWATAFSANVITNTWLGFPFMMVVAIGALESIPKELYEAASVDGASAWQRFKHITLPHLRPALGPAVAMGSIWTFNMFNVIFLVSGGRPGGSTNILVTDAYRWAFERGERYGMAAAYAAIIFLILLLWTVFGTRISRRKAVA